jgi:hypothetical protein
MIGTHVGQLKLGVALAKAFESIPVPFIGISRSIVLYPVQIRICDGNKALRGMQRGYYGTGSPHEIVERLVGLFLFRAEIETLTIDGDVPAVSISAIPGFWLSSHENPPE